jgi:hypothetical protein
MTTYGRGKNGQTGRATEKNPPFGPLIGTNGGAKCGRGWLVRARRHVSRLDMLLVVSDVIVTAFLLVPFSLCTPVQLCSSLASYLVPVLHRPFVRFPSDCLRT